MAGLLNLIPRYLPRFGMAPEWARASRPLVLVFMGVAFYVTYGFHANVDAQGGAYATGVLVLITSAACAVTLSVRTPRARLMSWLVTLIFIYTTAMNIWERPEGLKISCIFIACMMFVSFVSRATRSTELRVTGVEFSEDAKEFIRAAGDQPIRIIAHRRPVMKAEDLDQIEAFVRKVQGLSEHAPIIFLAGRAHGRFGVQSASLGSRPEDWAPLHVARAKPHGVEFHRGDTDSDRKDDGASAAHLLQLERGKSRGEYLSISLSRRGRCRSSYARSVAKGCTGDRAAADRSCQLKRRWRHAGL